MEKTIAADRFQILFDHASDAHFIFMDNGITDCNDAAVTLLKCRSKSEVLARHPRIFSPEYQPDGRLSLEKSMEMDAIARKRGWHRFEWVHQKVDGETFPVEVTLNVVEIDGKQAMIAVWHDLTGIKQTERQLKDLNIRMRNELESASEFQRSLFPAESPRSEKFSSAWFYKPCDELGGDSLNIIQIDPTHVALYVLDVTGHGVTSALLSVTATHFLSGYIKNHDYCPKQLVEYMNRHFSREPYVNHAFTLVYGVLDLETLAFTYTSAGHIGPIRVTAGAKTEVFDGHGPPVGLFAEAEYDRSSIQLKPGDRLFLISDGVYEVRSNAQEDFGIDRTCRHLDNESINDYSLGYTVNSLARQVFHWCLPEKPNDDISIVGVEILDKTAEDIQQIK